MAPGQARAAEIFASLGLGPGGELNLRGGNVKRRNKHKPPAVSYSSSLATAAPKSTRVFYKAVAVVPDKSGCSAGSGAGESSAATGARFLSIYDGVTHYRIGVDMYQPIDDDEMSEACGGFFCYTDAQQVFTAIVPSNSVLKSAERVVLKCLGWGARRQFPNGKIAIERLRPIGLFPFPMDTMPARQPRFDSKTALGPSEQPGSLTRRLQRENFALEEEVRQMESRLEAAQTMKAWGQRS